MKRPAETDEEWASKWPWRKLLTPTEQRTDDVDMHLFRELAEFHGLAGNLYDLEGPSK